MSITNGEIIPYAAVNRPLDDVSTGGGAADANCVVGFLTHPASANVISFVSTNSGDTMNVTLTGRLASGVYVTETFALNGLTEVSSANSYQRVLSITIASQPAGLINMYLGAGTGTFLGQLNGPAAIYKNAVLFQKSASGASPITRYDKIFFKNTDPTLTLTSATVTLTADASTRISIGLETALNDSNTITNRLTAPAGITFQGVGVAINVPNSQNLTAGSYIGVWIKQALLANDSAWDQGNFAAGASLKITLSGNTT
jgi:hypothetical protein